MNYLNYEFDLGQNDIIQVTLDKQANVRLLDAANFQLYRNGQQYRYNGGLAKTSPIEIKPPYAGHWHLVIDLGGYPGTVRASTRIISGA
jgi:hypothetical protein